MIAKLVRGTVIASIVAAVLYMALGAGLSGGFGFALPDGSRYIVQFQVQAQHFPPPEPEPEEDPVLRLEPSEKT